MIRQKLMTPCHTWLPHSLYSTLPCFSVLSSYYILSSYATLPLHSTLPSHIPHDDEYIHIVNMIRQKLIDTVPHEVTSLYPTLSLYPVILLYPVTLRHPATLLYCTLSYTT